MKRRDLLKFGAIGVAHAGASRVALLGQTPPQAPPAAKADYTLRISPVAVELDRSRIISTIGYNGMAPGPVLRMREGKTMTID